MNLLPCLLDAARGAIVLGAALAVMPLSRRAPASTRRAILVSALGVALLAPISARALAGSPAARVAELPVLVREVAVDPIVEPTAVAPSPGGAAVAAGGTVIAAPTAEARAAWPAWQLALGALWALGALAVVARLALGHARARRLVRGALVTDPRAFAEVLAAAQRDTGARARVAISEDVSGPAVAGLFAPVVLMPRAALGWSERRWRLVLLHELSHVRRLDCLANVVAQLACAMHWFNPLVWIATARLHRERELAADEQVLAAGERPSDYAEHLVAIAAAATPCAAVPEGAIGMAEPRSELSARVEAIVREPARERSSPVRALAFAFTAAALVLVVACAGPRTAPAHEPGTPVAAMTPADTASAATQAAAAPSTHAAPEAGAGLAEEVAAAVGAPVARVELTLRPAVQKILDEEMPRLTSEWKPAAATAIVLAPATGEIVALAGAATARRAYVTGSTLKSVTVAAALDTDSIRADQKFDCENGRRLYGQRTLRDAGAYGWLDVGQVLAVSSNVGASKIFDLLGGARLGQYFTRFHFGEASTVQLPNVDRGQVPAMADAASFEGAVIASGEGLTATPLQMAAAYGALANGGEYVAPTLARRVLDDAGRATWTHTPRRERVVRAETARALMTMLEGAVGGEQATGKGARVQGVRVAGKTGTGEWTTPDGAEHRYVSFIGVVPADAPRYVILVGVEGPRDGASGGAVAAPAFARIAARAHRRALILPCRMRAAPAARDASAPRRIGAGDPETRPVSH